MTLDILAFAAHPDDTELSCSGTLAAHVAQGYKAGVVDLTQGEMGTRGDVETRMKEAADAASVIGLSIRDNLKLADTMFVIDEDSIRKVVQKIRQYRPSIVLANAVHDRHPDHPRASELVSRACFMAGLARFETVGEDGNPQEAWRPDAVYHYVQSLYIKPDFVVDISEFWQTKVKAMKAFRSQFFDPSSEEPETFVSTEGFMKMIESRAREYGYVAGVEYAEGFTVERFAGVKNLFNLI